MRLFVCLFVCDTTQDKDGGCLRWLPLVGSRQAAFDGAISPVLRVARAAEVPWHARGKVVRVSLNTHVFKGCFVAFILQAKCLTLVPVFLTKLLQMRTRYLLCFCCLFLNMPVLTYEIVASMPVFARNYSHVYTHWLDLISCDCFACASLPETASPLCSMYYTP